MSVRRCALVALAIAMIFARDTAPRADSTVQTLPFMQDWSNIGLITADDDWSGVPGISGYRGDGLAPVTATDPQTILADGTAVADVNANKTVPNTFTTGGVTEFEITNPTVAIQGSGTAQAPFILLNLNTTGFSNINISYNLRDVDGSTDNAIQPVALQYRVGSSGNFTNIPAGFVADATTGPSLATQVTQVLAAVPGADNQPLIQVRIITANAVGNDEWVGVDDIVVTGTQMGPTNPSGVGTATPNIVNRGGQTFLTVTVTPGQNPTSQNIMVSADLTAIGGGNMQQMFDDGVSGGDVSAGDDVFSYVATIFQTATPGAHSLPVTITDAQNRLASSSIALTIPANTVPQTLPFSQKWTGPTLLTADDDWSLVPGITGYRGDDPSNLLDVNPETILADTTLTPVDVIANQSDPDTLTMGGIAEFDGLMNPTSALKGDETADAPFILIAIDTTNRTNVNVAYNLRDLDGSANNANQQVALQYRVGKSGNFTNVPNGFVADATDPFAAGKVTPVSANLGQDADNQPLVQVRIITTNATGPDEWVGIDDILITAPQTVLSVAGSAAPSTVGVGGNVLLTATATPGQNPASTGINVVIDLSSIGGMAAQPMYDDGTNGDAQAGDNVFSVQTLVASLTSTGLKTLLLTATDAQQRMATAQILLEVASPTFPTGSGIASPSIVIAGGTTQLTVTATPGQFPTSQNLMVTADLTSIGGGPLTNMLDDGQNGDATAGDNIFSFFATVASNTTPGAKSLPFTVSDAQNRSSSGAIQLTVNPAAQPTAPAVAGQAFPATVIDGEQTLLTATVTPGANPPSTGIMVNGDLSQIGGAAPQQFFDDGTNGDALANDNVFSFAATVAGATTAGLKSLPLGVTDAQNRMGIGAISLTVQELPAQGSIVISQIYGGGGNSGATLRNDFIELLNRSTAPIDLTGWSVQYASAAGSSWQVTPLTGTIGPGQYFLIQEAAGAGGSVSLPAPDAVGTISMSQTAGKVALKFGTTPVPDGDACPLMSAASLRIFDFVGYGTSANCFEGNGPTPTLSATIAAIRRAGGCLETNGNAADFFVGQPIPRNTSSLPVDCSVPPPPPTPPEAINAIQGGSSVSPFVGQVVTTPIAVVTARRSNGFFLQTVEGSADDDNNPNTSEGIFVFTGGAPPAAAALGNAVQVTGTVVEFIPSADLGSPPTTEISGPLVTLISAGNPLPVPITLTATDTSPTGSIEQLERYEAMRVRVDSLTAISGTQGSISEANATSTSNGVFYGVVTGMERPFREPGIEVPDPLPMGAPATIPRFDANPERLRVDSDGQVGGVALEVSTDAVITNLVGPLDYAFRTYTILPDAATPPLVTGGMSATPVPDPTANQFTVASFNTQRFFDNLADPATDDPVLTVMALNNRMHKASLYIRNGLKTPDILGVQEVENLTTLKALAGKINEDALAAGQPNPMYDGFLVEGNDIGGIDVGFLVKLSRADVLELTQIGKTATYINPENSMAELLNDRPPLVLRATIMSPAGSLFPLTVIGNHLRSLSGVETSPRVRAKRRAQAEFLAQLIQQRQVANPNERIMSIGDYNAFEFNDGYVDVIGTIKGTPSPANQVVLASADLVNPDLMNLVEQLPANQRYSFSFDGNAQALDHMLITQNLFGIFSNLAYGRGNSDSANSLKNNPQRPERISDHDGSVAYFNFPIDTLTQVSSSLNPSTFGQSATFMATVTSGGSPVTTGSVAFKDGDTLIGSAAVDNSGQASFSTSTLTAGTHTITAEYGSSGILGVSNASVSQTVNASATTTVVNSDINPSGFNQSVTFTATVSGVNGPATEGSVDFKEGNTVLAGPVTVNSNGKASFNTSALASGGHVITAEYSGSGNFNPSTGSMTQTVLPGVSINDVTVAEGNVPSTVAATFTVSLSAASLQIVTVNFATANGTATSGSDYIARTGVLVFPPAVTTQTITVPINSDVLNEADENFFVNLTAATNAVIVDGQGLGTITNNDPLPNISINDVTVREVNAGTVNAIFTVSLSAASGRMVTADFTTSDGTATSPEDYVSKTGTVTFNPGQLSQAITVLVNGDTITEANEIFLLVLSNLTNANLVDGMGIATITNDDALPSLAINDVSVTEPDSGSVNAVFAVSLSNPSQLTTIVRFATANSTALAGSDYTATNGTLVFGPGTLTQTIDVNVLADALLEPVQTFFVNLSLPANATIRDGQGIGSIFDASRPKIDSFSPLTGVIGTTVMITGSDFIGSTSVRFNNATAAFTVLSPTSIRATVPATASTGPISVTSASGTGVSDLNFGVLPKITSFTPTSGTVGTMVTINGSGLTGPTNVRFNGTEAVFASVTATQIRATVPAGATSGPITVVTVVGTDSTAGLSTPNFKVLPRITGFTPASGPVGTVVTINGNNLTGGTVRFNNVVAATVNFISDSQITAVVPPTATTGRISVTTGDGTALSTTNFGVTPSITSFVPTEGVAGTLVTITGSSFTGVTAVKFGGINAPFTILSPTSIRATVPASAATGPISIATAAGTATSAQSFKVLPRINSFTPTSGVTGTLVTITGTHLGGATEVQFNGSAATFTIMSPTQIRATVPAGATTGSITVVTADGTFVTNPSTGKFTVLPRIDNFTPLLGSVGTVVTISGTNLSNVTEVRFNTVAAATVNVLSANQITATVPPTATTGRITVTTPDGVATSATNFIITPRIDSFTPATGVPGTLVTITGSNFTGLTSVRFNGVSATFTLLSPTSIRATVPALATSGPISVTTSAGTAASATSFSVLPRIVLLVPSSGIVGSTVFIGGTGFTGATEVRFGTVNAASFTVMSPVLISAVVPATAPAVAKVSVTTPEGTAISLGNFTVLTP